MEKPEMKLVELENSDIITTSGGDGLLRIFNLGNDIPNDAYFTFGGIDKNQYLIYEADSLNGWKLTDFYKALNTALNVSDTINGETKVYRIYDSVRENLRFVKLNHLSKYDSDSDASAASNYNGTYRYYKINGEYAFKRID